MSAALKQILTLYFTKYSYTGEMIFHPPTLVFTTEKPIFILQLVNVKMIAEKDVAVSKLNYAAR